MNVKLWVEKVSRPLRWFFRAGFSERLRGAGRGLMERLSRAAARFLETARSLAASRRPEAAWLALGLAVGTAGAFCAGEKGFLPREPWAPRRLALTFDDGPHPAFTGRLLDILRDGGARATFFVVGRPADERPALIKDILRRNCAVANHTYDHPNLTKISSAELLAELDLTQRILERDGVRGARFFRPPGGRFNARVLSAARAAGYRMVLWTVLPEDHERPAADVIRRRVLSEVSDGGVVLLHSGVESTVRALPEILKELRARGYRCVTVEELLSERRPTDPTALWLDAPSLPPRPALPPEAALEDEDQLP